MQDERGRVCRSTTWWSTQLGARSREGAEARHGLKYGNKLCRRGKGRRAEGEQRWGRKNTRIEGPKHHHGIDQYGNVAEWTDWFHNLQTKWVE